MLVTIGATVLLIGSLLTACKLDDWILGPQR